MSGFERAAIALLTLAIVGLVTWAIGRSVGRLKGVAVLTVVLTFVLVVFGAFVRLSDAGLGCPDWPGCYGDFTPAHAQDSIAAAQALDPHGPVSMPKAWKEMLHRYLAMLVGCLILAMAIAAVRLRTRAFTAPLHAWVNVAVVILQGAFGALTVTMLLKPAIVTGHLIGGMSILGLLVLYTLRVAPRAAPASAAGLRGVAVLALLVLALQIALGGWVSTNYAASVCGDLPTCQGRWLPPMDFGNAFHIVRELGKTASGDNLSLAALTAIQMTHRAFAVLVLAVFLWTGWRAVRTAGTRVLGLALIATVMLQVAIGLKVVWAMSAAHLELPLQLPAAAAHNAGAALLVVLTVLLNFRAFSAPSR